MRRWNDNTRENRNHLLILIGIIAVSAFLTWASNLASVDTKVIDACVKQGGVVVNSMQGFVCVRKEFLIDVKVKE